MKDEFFEKALLVEDVKGGAGRFPRRVGVRLHGYRRAVLGLKKSHSGKAT